MNTSETQRSEKPVMYGIAVACCSGITGWHVVEGEEIGTFTAAYWLVFPRGWGKLSAGSDFA
jgi:hypothetical protein